MIDQKTYTEEMDIQMVDLIAQYRAVKNEIDSAIQDVLNSARFIKGPIVQSFEEELSEFLSGASVITCANGTDALQIALMSLGLKPGDEVIVPAFTYVATAEVIGLLGLRPIMVDVDPDFFNTDVSFIASHITPRTKAIVPVHLYGQSCDLGPIMKLAKDHDLYVIEDAAQSIGSKVYMNDEWHHSGTVGHIGCTSFFPSKNLGCYGDGGALFTRDKSLAEKIKMIANHGQKKKYYHSVIGVNSRLDALQAAVLRIKLRHLRKYCEVRNQVADSYDQAFADHDFLAIPKRSTYSKHVFHQYTLKVAGGHRDNLKSYLSSRQIPSMIYYPLPLYEQEAYKEFYDGVGLKHTEKLCRSVLSLPIHTEMTESQLDYIQEGVLSYFRSI